MIAALIRYLIFRYGEKALDWTIRQLLETESATPDVMADQTCQAVLAMQKQGLNLDPDCGVYYWELPSKEQ